MPKPSEEPIGLALAQAAKVVSRAFDDALAAAGGSLPVWLVLLALQRAPGRNQREIADIAGIHGATLTHHLNAMERDGLVRRQRTETNRRDHEVLLTDRGKQAFRELAAAAQSFNTRLTAGLSESELAATRATLGRLVHNL
jgi:MarR family transcriptional regulator for hemolysin